MTPTIPSRSSIRSLMWYDSSMCQIFILVVLTPIISSYLMLWSCLLMVFPCLLLCSLLGWSHCIWGHVCAYALFFSGNGKVRTFLYLAKSSFFFFFYVYLLFGVDRLFMENFYFCGFFSLRDEKYESGLPPWKRYLCGKKNMCFLFGSITQTSPQSSNLQKHWYIELHWAVAL